MSTADLYIRVSTDEQAVKGFSQRSQEERLQKYCSLHKIEILRIVFEDHSAKSFKRPAWLKLMAEWSRYKEKRPDVLLFTQWDRFSRNAGDAYYMINKLKHLGIEPRAIDQPVNLAIPENKMMLALYLASSEVENDRRSLNVKMGLYKARKEGRWPGPAPIGYLNVTAPAGQKYIIPHEPEATVIRQVFSLLAEAKYSIHQVYEHAITIGLKCSVSHFQNIIRNPFYCGKVIVPAFEKEKEYLVKGIHEQLITEHLFNQVQAIIAAKKKISVKNADPKEQLLLRGFLLCPDCGKLLTGSASKGRYKRYFYYHCSGGCHFRIRADKTNLDFAEILKGLVPLAVYADVFKLVLEEVYRELYEKKTTDQAHTIKSMEQMIDRIVKAREALYNGNIDSDDFAAIKDDCEHRINTLGVQLQHLTAVQLTKKERLEKIAQFIFRIDDLYNRADMATRRQIIALVLGERTVYRQQMEQMLSTSFQHIFNLWNHAFEREIDPEDASHVIDENVFYKSCEQLIMSELSMSGVSPVTVRNILKSLEKLASITLNINN